VCTDTGTGLKTTSITPPYLVPTIACRKPVVCGVEAGDGNDAGDGCDDWLPRALSRIEIQVGQLAVRARDNRVTTVIVGGEEAADAHHAWNVPSTACP
jgi:hypothetical protein